MEPTQILIVALLMFFCTAMQAAVGFGFGLFAIPIMLMAGIDLPNAITLAIVATFFQCLLGAVRLREHADVRPFLGVIVLRFAFMPVGVFLLAGLLTFGEARVKQVIGLTLLAVLLAQWLFKVKPRDHVHWLWTFIAGTISGLCGGALGMGGPPVVIWVMAHKWPGDKVRASLFTLFASLVPLQLLVMLLKFGPGLLYTALIACAFVPLMYLGSAVGLRIGAAMSDARLRAAGFALLLVIAVNAIVGPWLQGSPSDALDAPARGEISKVEPARYR